MDAKDLRLGNLLENFIGEVFEVNPTTISDFNNEFGRPKPIPITEEWLLKFGFKEYLSGYVDTSKIQYTEIKISKKGFDIALNRTHFEFHYNKSNYSRLFKTIFYIHEMQNLYFVLTDKELKTI